MLTDSAPALALPVLRAQWLTPLCLNSVVTMSKVTDGLGLSPVAVHVTVDGTPDPHFAVLPAYTPVSKSTMGQGPLPEPWDQNVIFEKFRALSVPGPE